jgi:hypothetical protein
MTESDCSKDRVWQRQQQLLMVMFQPPLANFYKMHPRHTLETISMVGDDHQLSVNNLILDLGIIKPLPAPFSHKT